MAQQHIHKPKYNNIIYILLYVLFNKFTDQN